MAAETGSLPVRGSLRPEGYDLQLRGLVSARKSSFEAQLEQMASTARGPSDAAGEAAEQLQPSSGRCVGKQWWSVDCRACIGIACLRPANRPDSPNAGVSGKGEGESAGTAACQNAVLRSASTRNGLQRAAQASLQKQMHHAISQHELAAAAGAQRL